MDYGEKELFVDPKTKKHIKKYSYDDEVIYNLLDNREGDPRHIMRTTVLMQDGRHAHAEVWHRQKAAELKEILDELADAQGLPKEMRKEFYATHILNRLLAFEPAKASEKEKIHRLAEKHLRAGEYDQAELARILPEKMTRAKALQLIDVLRSRNPPRSWKALKRRIDTTLGTDDRVGVPDELFQPFLKKRRGETPYFHSALLMFEAYMRYALRKIHMEPAVNEVKPILETMPGKGHAWGPFYMSQREYGERLVNRILGRPSKADVSLDAALERLARLTNGLPLRIPIIRGLFRGRAATRLTTGLLRLQYFRLLGLSIRSTVTNLTQGMNTLAQTGLRNTMTGYLRLMTDPKLWKQMGEEHLMQEFKGFYVGTEPFFAKPLSQVEQLFLRPFQWAEFVNRGAAFAAGMAEGKRAGMSSEMSIRLGHGEVRRYLSRVRPDETQRAFYTSAQLEHARRTVLQTQFGYNPVESSPMFGTPSGRLLFQFWNFPTQHASFFLDGLAAREKLFTLPWFRMLALLGFTVYGGKTLANQFGWDVSNLWSFWGVAPSGFGPNYQAAMDLWAASGGDVQAQRKLPRHIRLRAWDLVDKPFPHSVLPGKPLKKPSGRRQRATRPRRESR
jgi:hypothetical protein